MVLDTNPFSRGKAARLDFHAHSSRLLQSGVSSDFAYAVYAAGKTVPVSAAEAVHPSLHCLFRTIEGRGAIICRRCQQICPLGEFA